ncbi:MAG: response regulator [Thermodesulfobacteriota bacterium]
MPIHHPPLSRDEFPSPAVAPSTEKAFIIEVLRSINRATDLSMIADIVTTQIRIWLGMAAAGIRLKQGLDYPYFATVGFSPDFIETESHLCAQDGDGRSIMDTTGMRMLECMCGAVLSGRIGSDPSCFTAYGSFWTNSTTDLLAATKGNSGVFHPRNRCNTEGFESIALIPLKTAGETVGLLQFNDHQKNRLSRETIHLLEPIAGNIAASIAHRLAIETIKENEQKLRQTQKMEAIGALAGGIAHDFNNILFPLIGFAEMLQSDLPENGKHREFTDEILKAALRAKELVKQILAFSREAEKEIKPLQIQLILKEVLKLIRSTLPATIRVKQNIDNRCGMVLADPTHIHQIAMNLITNAYHAMEDTGGTLTIGLKETVCDHRGRPSSNLAPGEYVVLSVADTGCGMNKTTLEKIFDPYFTTKPKEKGTGLGLAVIHGIVKSYYGDILVRSEPGQGSAFEIYLPRGTGLNEPDTSFPGLETAKGSEQILLVDDEEPILKMEKQMLEMLGYRVETRTSAREALAAFSDRPEVYDLVITDMTMPDMTGADLSRRLLKIRPDLPIIVCTGFSEKITPEIAFHIGIKGFLTKPAVKSELGAILRKVLDERRGND